MTRMRFLLAILLGVAPSSCASAQVIAIIGMPPPFVYRQFGPAISPYSYGYAYGGWYPGYGIIDQRVTVQIINPPGVVVQTRRVVERPKYDLSGIDLDVESADKIWGSKQNAKGPAMPKNAEMARPAAPEEKKQVIAVPAKPPAPVPPPKLELPPDGKRLVDMGIFAFRRGEYGTALLRFRQASEENPPGPRTAFLQGQACIAVGKYREAVRLIQMGLQREPTWPTSGFAPKADLYNNNAEVWNAHREQLEQAQRNDPKNADYLFLLGYLAWFDGQRDAAIDYFQRSSALAAEPRWSEAFLQAAKK